MLQGQVFSLDGHPLERISVSDGAHVTLTDQNGRFVLEGWEKCAFVYCNVLTNRQDDWYLPAKDHKGDFIFHLDLVKDTKDFSFFHFSDTEVEDKALTFLPYLKERIAERKPLFVFVGGDLHGVDGIDAHHEQLNCESISCPVRYSIGNHDYVQGEYGEKYFEDHFGPVWYSFTIGEIHFIVMRVSYGSRISSNYLFEEQCRWIKADLALCERGKRLAVFRHDSFVEGQHFHAKFEDWDLDLKEKDLILCIYGHDHAHYAIENDGVRQICTARPDSGGIDNSVAGIREISIRGKEFDYQLHYSLLPPTSPPSPALWRSKVAGQCGLSSLLDLGEDLAVATLCNDSRGQCGVSRLDGKTGKILWFTPTENSVKNDIASDGKRIFAQDCEGNVYALCAETGKLLWKFSPQDDSKQHIAGSVLTRDGKVFAGTGQRPLILSAQDGTLLATGEVLRCGKIATARHVLHPEENLVYYNALWHALTAVDTDTGETRWTLKRTASQIGPHSAFWYGAVTPVYHNGRLYCFGFHYGGYVDAVTGEVLCHKKINGTTVVSGAPTIDGDTLYLPTGKEGVLALDADTLEEKWRYPVGTARIFSSSYVFGEKSSVEGSVQIHEGETVFAANDGRIYFCDTRSPEIHRTLSLDSPTLTAPLIRKDGIFTASFDGTISKLKK